MWVSEKRLYLTADERVVPANDPDGRTLLVAAGGSLPFDEAQRYGLLVGASEPIEPAETAEAPQATTAEAPADQPSEEPATPQVDA